EQSKSLTDLDRGRRKGISTASELSSMPDGLMPCTAPFSILYVMSPRSGAFCCDSRPEFRNFALDPSKTLAENWNNKHFREARTHFINGDYDKVCHGECHLYQQYLAAHKKNEIDAPRCHRGKQKDICVGADG